jgi:hypothetical protein
VAGDPSLADQFETTLDSLEGRCRESPHDIAAEVYATHEVLKNDGFNESYPTILDSLDTEVPQSATDFDCKGALAAWVVVREKG